MPPDRQHSLPSVQRFTNRVEDYTRYRPGYPAAVVDVARRAFALSPDAIIADVGSGTGKLSLEFLRAGYEVHGIEPNAAMREAATEELAGWKLFHNVAGTAEALPLRDDSVALIVAGQAFHWFDPVRTRTEFVRALRPGGGLMLVWNNRDTERSAFLQAYEQMLDRHCPDYANVGNKHYERDAIDAFFGGEVKTTCLHHTRYLDEAALIGLLFSASYTPASGAAREELASEARRLFTRHAKDGRVELPYRTEIFSGRLAENQG